VKCFTQAKNSVFSFTESKKNTGGVRKNLISKFSELNIFGSREECQSFTYLSITILGKLFSFTFEKRRIPLIVFKFLFRISTDYLVGEIIQSSERLYLREVD